MRDRLPWTPEEKVMALLVAILTGVCLVAFRASSAVARARKCYEVDLVIGNLGTASGAGPLTAQVHHYDARVNGVVCEK